MVIWKLLGKLIGKQKTKSRLIAMEKNIDSETTIRYYLNFKRAGNVVHIEASWIVPAGVTLYSTICNISDYIPEWAKPTAKKAEDKVMTIASNSIIRGNDKHSTIHLRRTQNGLYTFYDLTYMEEHDQDKIVESFLTYIIDDDEEDYILGDVNGDGVVDAKDLYLIRDYTMGYMNFTPRQFKAADMNNDGQVKSADYVKLKNQLGL